MGEEDEHDLKDKSGYTESGVQLASLGSDDLVSMLFHT